jgi:hypothetical protein
VPGRRRRALERKLAAAFSVGRNGSGRQQVREIIRELIMGNAGVPCAA